MTAQAVSTWYPNSKSYLIKQASLHFENVQPFPHRKVNKPAMPLIIHFSRIYQI